MKPEDLQSIPKPHYYDQQLLKVEDFQREQSYHIASRELQTRFLFAPGILLGLAVGLDAKIAGQLQIGPGLAVDRLGRQIILAAGAAFDGAVVPLEAGVFTLDLTDKKYQGKKWLLAVEYAEAADANASQWQEFPLLALRDAADSSGAGTLQLALATIDITVSGTTEKPEVQYTLDASVQTPAALLVPAQQISAAQISSGVLDEARIPDLSAEKITSGTFAAALIPAIPASRISGSLDADKIPDLSAAKITSGVLSIEQVPDIPASKLTGKLSADQLPDGLPGGSSFSINVDKPIIEGEETVTLSWAGTTADEVRLEYVAEEKRIENTWKVADGAAPDWPVTPYQTSVYTLTALKAGVVQARSQFTVQVIQNAFQYLKSRYFLGTPLANALQLCVNRYQLLPFTPESMQRLADAAQRANYAADETLTILKTYPQKVTTLATPVITDFTNSDQNFLIQWNPVPNAESYELELKDGAGLQTLKADANANALTYTAAAKPGPGTYAVVMRAVAGPVYSEWCAAATLTIPEPQATQHHWAFDESTGDLATDAIGGVVGKLTPSVQRESPGCIGSGAVHLNGSDDSLVNFGTQIGQFGTSDFTVALWFKTTETLRYFDVIGNRTVGSHGNFFSLRMSGQREPQRQGTLYTEIDEDGRGKNFIELLSSHKDLNDGKWHHTAVVRAGNSLKLYVDGTPSAEGSAKGVANISNGNDFKLGRSLVGNESKFTPQASYDELWVVGSALPADEIAKLFSARDTSGDGPVPGDDGGKKLYFNGQAYGELNYWDPDYRDNTEANTLFNPINNGFTIEAMVYLTAEGAKLPVISAYLPAGSQLLADGPSLYLSINDGKPSFAMTVYSWNAGSPSSPTLKVLDVDVKLPLNQWTRLSVTHNQGSPTIYLNGKAVASAYFGTSMPNFTHYFLGKADNSFFTGYIREVRLWRGAKTAEEILKFSTALLGSQAKTLVPAGLGAYYPLTEGDGPTAEDGIKHNDFQLQNTSWLAVPTP